MSLNKRPTRTRQPAQISKLEELEFRELMKKRFGKAVVEGSEDDDDDSPYEESEASDNSSGSEGQEDSGSEESEGEDSSPGKPAASPTAAQLASDDEEQRPRRAAPITPLKRQNPDTGSTPQVARKSRKTPVSHDLATTKETSEGSSRKVSRNTRASNTNSINEDRPSKLH